MKLHAIKALVTSTLGEAFNRREGIVLYELDDEPLAEPKPLTPKAAYRTAEEHFQSRFPGAQRFLDTFDYVLNRGRQKQAAFVLHQAIEVLLVLTNYSPP